jgi:GTP-binding protein HflX
LGNSNGSEKAVLVGLILPRITRSVAEEHLEELQQLTESAGAESVARIVQERPSPDPATYIGRGKAEEVAQCVKDSGAAVVIFDDELSAAQIRNLEKIIPARVVDRSALILDIFSRQARSRESRTQVELAQLNYMLPRLTRQWSHLSRQSGGAGAKRGVGETQLELDRRMIKTRIAKLKDELKKIEKTRETQRRGRETAFTIALVGYTNAGKSTLFNRLTNGSVEAVDRLFATLDAKLQKAAFEMPRETVVIDTVGFVRKLPHHLVASFRSTMEEAVSADLVLHVINLCHPQLDEQREVGNEVLRELGIPDERVIEVYNKADQIEGGIAGFAVRPKSVTVSALTGDGIDRLVTMLRHRELSGGDVLHLEIPNAESRLIAQLFEVAQVHEQTASDESVRFVAWIPASSAHIFEPYVVDGTTMAEGDVATG